MIVDLSNNLMLGYAALKNFLLKPNFLVRREANLQTFSHGQLQKQDKL